MNSDPPSSQNNVNAAPLPPPRVPDHELLRRIGRGAYGEVWLARSITGAFRAVKIVHRQSFDHDRPFEREFEGILKFEPISRRHDSQVDILHVGRGDDCFYYVMELADDQATGGQINPDHYAPRTLKSDLLFHGRLPFEECVRIGLALTTALENLHGNGLAHRDVKPSNIIFVNGVPKLADIGLVAGVEATRSYVGTEGFAAPEGPGSAQADIYSLGKVLYEISMGKDRQEFPELPTALRELPDRDGLMELNAVIARACRHDPKDRYASATAMRSDLELLQSGKSLARLHRTEAQLRFVRRAGAIVTVIAALAAGLYLWQARQTKIVLTMALENAELLSRERTARRRVEMAEELVRSERDRAVISEKEARAVLDFFQRSIIAAARPQSEPGGLGLDVTVIQALEVAEERISFSFVNRPLVEAELRMALGRTYALLGNYTKSLDHQKRARALRQTVLGDRSLQTLEAAVSVAGALQLLGKHREAVPLLEDVVRQATLSLGATNSNTLDFLTTLGIAHRQAQQMDQAIAELQLAYDRRKEIFGPTNPATLATLNHLAVTHQLSGQPTQAVMLLKELHEQFLRTQGTDHEDTTRVMIDLARALQAIKRWDEARPLFESALETRRRTHGPKHPATFIALEALSDAFFRKRMYAEAEPLQREAVAVRESELGSNHPETTDARQRLAFLLSEWAWVDYRQSQRSINSSTAEASKRALEAERIAREILANLTLELSSRDHHVIDLRTLLGGCLAAAAATATNLDVSERLAKLAEGESLLLEARRGLQELEPAAYRDSNGNAAYLTRLYEAWNALSPDEAMAAKAAQSRRQSNSDSRSPVSTGRQ